MLGVDPGQIVRRYPAPGSTNAEETFHAHIEFDRPELPWAFSAQTAGDRMRPWLALVVVERDEIEWEPAQAGLQPIMAVDGRQLLPPLDDGVGVGARPDRRCRRPAVARAAARCRRRTRRSTSRASWPRGCCARTPTTSPAWCRPPSVGAQAGLGIAGGGLGPAWTPQDGRVRLPVYDRWEFRTAPGR